MASFKRTHGDTAHRLTREQSNNQLAELIAAHNAGESMQITRPMRPLGFHIGRPLVDHCVEQAGHLLQTDGPTTAAVYLRSTQLIEATNRVLHPQIQAADIVTAILQEKPDANTDLLAIMQLNLPEFLIKNVTATIPRQKSQHRYRTTPTRQVVSAILESVNQPIVAAEAALLMDTFAAGNTAPELTEIRCDLGWLPIVPDSLEQRKATVDQIKAMLLNRTVALSAVQAISGQNISINRT